MRRLTGFVLALGFASLQVLVAQEGAVQQKQKELNELAGKKTETPKTNRIVIGKGEVAYPNSDVKKSNDTKEDPSLKAERRDIMAKRKIAREKSKANSRETANALSRVGSQMVAGVVQRANDERIKTQRVLNNAAGRQSSGELTTQEKQLRSSFGSMSSSGRSTSSANRSTSLYQCDKCGKVWSAESTSTYNFKSHDNPLTRKYCSGTGKKS